MATVSGMCISDPRFSEQGREFSSEQVCNLITSAGITDPNLRDLQHVTGGVPESWAFFLERTIVMTVETNTGLFKCGGCSDQCIGMCL